MFQAMTFKIIVLLLLRLPIQILSTESPSPTSPACPLFSIENNYYVSKETKTLSNKIPMRTNIINEHVYYTTTNGETYKFPLNLPWTNEEISNARHLPEMNRRNFTRGFIVEKENKKLILRSSKPANLSINSEYERVIDFNVDPQRNLIFYIYGYGWRHNKRQQIPFGHLSAYYMNGMCMRLPRVNYEKKQFTSISVHNKTGDLILGGRDEKNGFILLLKRLDENPCETHFTNSITKIMDQYKNGLINGYKIKLYSHANNLCYDEKKCNQFNGYIHFTKANINNLTSKLIHMLNNTIGSNIINKSHLNENDLLKKRLKECYDENELLKTSTVTENNEIEELEKSNTRIKIMEEQISVIKTGMEAIPTTSGIFHSKISADHIKTDHDDYECLPRRKMEEFERQHRENNILYSDILENLQAMVNNAIYATPDLIEVETDEDQT